MLREELIHPILVHFPIALVSLTFFLRTILWLPFFCKNEFLKNAFYFCFYLGMFSYLPSIFSGEMAFDVVREAANRTSDIYAHEEAAELSMYIFLVSGSVHVLLQIFSEKLKKWQKLLIEILCYLLITAGFLTLAHTAHLGGNLVYNQGIGVRAK